MEMNDEIDWSVFNALPMSILQYFEADRQKYSPVCGAGLLCDGGWQLPAQAETRNILRTVLMVAVGLEAFGAVGTERPQLYGRTLVTTLHLFHQPEFPPGPSQQTSILPFC